MDKEKEIKKKLQEASEPDDVFTLKIEHNGKEIVEKVSFSISKYSKTTIKASKLYYMLLDFSRKVQEELVKKDRKIKLNEK